MWLYSTQRMVHPQLEWSALLCHLHCASMQVGTVMMLSSAVEVMLTASTVGQAQLSMSTPLLVSMLLEAPVRSCNTVQ